MSDAFRLPRYMPEQDDTGTGTGDWYVYDRITGNHIGEAGNLEDDAASKADELNAQGMAAELRELASYLKSSKDLLAVENVVKRMTELADEAEET